jgi:DNA polymerase III alpha subunit
MQNRINLKFDSNMFPILTEEQAVEALLQGHRITQKIVDPNCQSDYVAAREKNIGDYVDIFYQETPIDYHDQAIHQWMIPDEYKDLDVYQLVKSRCSTQEEFSRLDLEWQLFEKYHFVDKLQAIVYIIDCFKDNNVVWGVGRGSSVASFVLYKLEVHMINPIEYNLDFNEFFKENHG